MPDHAQTDRSTVVAASGGLLSGGRWTLVWVAVGILAVAAVIRFGRELLAAIAVGVDATGIATTREVFEFVAQLVNGLTLGAIYALIAIGYTMVYGIIGMINFAHGEIFMISAFVALITFALLGAIGLTWIPLAILLALLMAALLTSVYGFTLERVAYRPLRGSQRLAALITAIGMSIFLQTYVQLAQGARNKPLGPFVGDRLDFLTNDGVILMQDAATGTDVKVTYIRILIIVVTVAVMAVFSWIVAKTALGRAQRACEQDRQMAALLGINVDRTIAITFIMGAALAAVAGSMVLMMFGFSHFFMGFLYGIKAFTAAVLGGIGSLPGALVGGILLGLIETIWQGYFSADYKDVAAFSILVLVLIFRPTGILGKPDIEKV